MRIWDALGSVRQGATPVPATPIERAARALPVPNAGRVVRSGVAAGATVVALSAASAVASALRRRSEGS
jgi:hypothetical protein